MKKTGKAAVKNIKRKAKAKVAAKATALKSRAVYKATALKTKAIHKAAKYTAPVISTSDYEGLVSEVVNKIKNTNYRQIATDALKDIDYKSLTKDVLKVVLPMIALKAVFHKSKPAKPKWEETFEPIVKNLKDKINNL